MIDFVLHPGLAKCGSSTLQRALFTQHPEIHYLGKVYHNDVEKGCASQEIYDLLKPVLWKRKGYDPEGHRARFRSLVEDQAGDSKCTVGSWEGLGDTPPHRFETMLTRMQETAGGRCRVLFVLRNPVSRFPSLYLQKLQGHYFKGMKSGINHTAYRGIEEWLVGLPVVDGVDYWGRYLANMKVAVDLCGRENVGILVFEQLRSDPASFYTALADFLRIDPERTRELCEGAHFNYRITETELQLMREKQASPIGRFIWSLKQPRVRRISLRRIKRRRGEEDKAAKVALPEDWRARLSDDTAEGHRWLESEFGIDLASHDYPL